MNLQLFYLERAMVHAAKADFARDTMRNPEKLTKASEQYALSYVECHRLIRLTLRTVFQSEKARAQNLLARAEALQPA